MEAATWWLARLTLTSWCLKANLDAFANCCYKKLFYIIGYVPEVKAENEEELPDSDPHWGIDIVFLKNTTLCYGPWVDRQR